jgi:hypothetical protein
MLKLHIIVDKSMIMCNAALIPVHLVLLTSRLQLERERRRLGPEAANYYCPRTHLWLRPMKSQHCADTSARQDTRA